MEYFSCILTIFYYDTSCLINKITGDIKMLITQSESLSILKPYQSKIRECVVSGWNAYITQYAHVRDVLTPRTRANIVFDHMCHHARQQFANTKDVHIRETNGLFLVDIQGKLQIRFKKLDDNNKSSNIQTQQTLNFYEQLELPGLPHATRLVAGYVLNDWETAIRTVTVTCPNGSEIEWYLELEEPPKVETINLPTESEIPEIRRRVRVKEIKKLKESQ